MKMKIRKRKAVQKMSNSRTEEARLKLQRAVIVEGRDDVCAAERALDALIIPTHGFGITAQTWKLIDKAAKEKGLIILTDPDHAGQQIRRKISEKYPDSVHAYLAREDAERAGDIGVENASPEVIKTAVQKALENESKAAVFSDDISREYADMKVLRDLGLAGTSGASEKRAKVSGLLGIGYGNANAMIKKLRGFGIDKDELREAVKEIE